MILNLILALFSCGPGEYEIQYHYALTRECTQYVTDHKLVWSVEPPVPFEDQGTFILIHQPPSGDYVVRLQVNGTDCVGEVGFHE